MTSVETLQARFVIQALLEQSRHLFELTQETVASPADAERLVETYCRQTNGLLNALSDMVTQPVPEPCNVKETDTSPEKESLPLITYEDGLLHTVISTHTGELLIKYTPSMPLYFKNVQTDMANAVANAHRAFVNWQYQPAEA